MSQTALRGTAVVLILLGLVLAGCTDDGPAQREQRADRLFITVTGDGPWHVRVPVPHDGAIGADDWREAVRVSLGNATITPIDGELALDIRGSGQAVMEGDADVEDPPCCVRGFQDGRWTAGDSDAIPFEVLEGHIDRLRVAHDVTSCRGHCDPEQGPVKTCGRSINGFATDIGPGRHELVFGAPTDHCPG